LIVGIRMVRSGPAGSLVLMISPRLQNKAVTIPTFAMPRPEHRQEGFPGRQDAPNF
jgi:hypothetical protein